MTTAVGLKTTNFQPQITEDAIKTYLNEIGRTELITAEQEVELAKTIEAGVYADYLLNEANKATDLAKKDLKLVSKAGKKAQQKLLQANLRLVVSLAKRYTGRGMPLLDLIQEGNLGLIRAMEKFDYKLGFKFSTYATWWIKQSISRGIADQAKTIRIPVHLVEQVNKIIKLRRELNQQLGRDISYAELSQKIGISESKIINLLERSRDPVSLDLQINPEDDAVLGDFIENNQVDTTETLVFNKILKDELNNILANFDTRERQLIELRYGLNNNVPRTLDQIGKLFNLSRERVRQIEQEVIAKIKNQTKSKPLKSYLT